MRLPCQSCQINFPCELEHKFNTSMDSSPQYILPQYIHQMSSLLPEGIGFATTILDASTSSSDNESLHPSRFPRETMKRKDVLLFIRVLLDHLELHDPQLGQVVRSVISQTIRENREGNPHYQQLARSVQVRVRAFVGEWHWRQVSYIIYYRKKVFRMMTRNIENNITTT